MAELIRIAAQPHLFQINKGVTGSSRSCCPTTPRLGGTCFGESGGPKYLGATNVIAGVTSFGLNNI